MSGVSTADGRTRLTIRTPGRRPAALDVSRDATVAPRAELLDVHVIGTLGSRALVLVDTYPSVPGGMSLCGAGEEQFVRVVALGSGRPTEQWHIKLASCRDDVELANAGVAWVADSATLRIRWLLGPTRKGEPEERTMRFDTGGRLLRPATADVQAAEPR